MLTRSLCGWVVARCVLDSSVLHLGDVATAFNLPTQVYKQWFTTVILTTLSHPFSLPSSTVCLCVFPVVVTHSLQLGAVRIV